MTAPLNELEERLGYAFRSRRKLEEALRHSSIKDEKHPSNERLEFLGDAVLGLAVTEFVYKTYPDLTEGELTAIKSVVVSSESLLKIARKLALRKFLAVGKGITKKRSIPDSLVANAVEALIGAIYLDSGFRAAKTFALEHIDPMVGRVVKKRTTANYKSQLQNYVQKKFGATPHYRLLTENGPDHRKTFELTAVVCDRTFPPGLGKTKKIASQQAARKALKILQNEYGKLPTASF
jgi:ribonuclease-3